jgi:hypothetical protein
MNWLRDCRHIQIMFDPFRKWLITGTVPANKNYVTGTLSATKNYVTVTVEGGGGEGGKEEGGTSS